MTLQEMSHDYAASADAIGERIRQLHQRALTAPDPEEVLCLQRRIRELMPLRRQARELAYHTAHYYDRGCTAMRHTVSDGSGHYDPLDIASLQLWQQGQQEDNRQQIRRLLVNLPLAVEEELTPRQRQLLRMHFTQGKRVTDIAQELGISKSTVSRTLARCTQRLYRTLRYSL